MVRLRSLCSWRLRSRESWRGGRRRRFRRIASSCGLGIYVYCECLHCRFALPSKGGTTKRLPCERIRTYTMTFAVYIQRQVFTSPFSAEERDMGMVRFCRHRHRSPNSEGDRELAAEGALPKRLRMSNRKTLQRRPPRPCVNTMLDDRMIANQLSIRVQTPGQHGPAAIGVYWESVPCSCRRRRVSVPQAFVGGVSVWFRRV